MNEFKLLLIQFYIQMPLYQKGHNFKYTLYWCLMIVYNRQFTKNIVQIGVVWPIQYFFSRSVRNWTFSLPRNICTPIFWPSFQSMFILTFFYKHTPQYFGSYSVLRSEKSWAVMLLIYLQDDVSLVQKY